MMAMACLTPVLVVMMWVVEAVALHARGCLRGLFRPEMHIPCHGGALSTAHDALATISVTLDQLSSAPNTFQITFSQIKKKYSCKVNSLHCSDLRT